MLNPNREKVKTRLACVKHIAIPLTRREKVARDPVFDSGDRPLCKSLRYVTESTDWQRNGPLCSADNLLESRGSGIPPMVGPLIRLLARLQEGVITRHPIKIER